MSNTGVLRTVTDRFCLFNDGRKLGANKRNYIISTVDKMINSEETQELLRLGEAVGYYGHGNRERANKLFLKETEVIMVNGKAVVVENVPSNRTTAISLDKKTGIVTHTEEILPTTAGRIIDSMIESKQGGWSWATSGIDTLKLSSTDTFAGVDYALRPNYLSLDHPSMMLESVGDRESLLLESLQSNVGLDLDSAKKVIMIGENDNYLVDRCLKLQNDVLILEGMVSENEFIANELLLAKEERTNAGEMILEAMSNLPIYMTEEQKKALINMKSEHDRNVISLLFESLKKTDMSTLPFGNVNNKTVVTKPISSFASKGIDYSLTNKCRHFG